jgi:co-chaperonin GroES (HSP10)
MNTSGIYPLDHRVLILPDKVEEKVGSIIMPVSETDKQKYAMTNAKIVAVGALAWSEAKHDAKTFGIDARFPQVGDRVKVGKYTGDVHKGMDGEDYTVVNDSDVIAMIEEEV